MVNFGPLTAEIGSGVWGTPANFFAALLYTASSSGRPPNFAALNRGRHLCSAGRPSRWALVHILVESFSVKLSKSDCMVQYRPYFWFFSERPG